MLRRFPIGYRPDRGVLSAEKKCLHKCSEASPTVRSAPYGSQGSPTPRSGAYGSEASPTTEAVLWWVG